MAFQFPFPRELINFASYFGHSGIDWSGSSVGNTARITSIGPGTVVAVNPYTWSGGSFIIDHGTIDGINITSLGAHMSSVTATVNQTVDAGTDLGQIGNTGESTGTHYHLEIIYNGSRLPTDTPGNNTPGLGFQRTLEWLDTHVGDTPDPTPRPTRRRNAWLNRPPHLYYRNW